MNEEMASGLHGTCDMIHAAGGDDIDALMKRIHQEASAAGTITALWIRLPAGGLQVQITCAAARPPAPTSAGMDRERMCVTLVHLVREALRSYNDLTLLDGSRLAYMLNLSPYGDPSDAGWCARGRALQRAILRAVARLDDRPSRRAIGFGRIFDCIYTHGMTQERAAELLHVEDRTVRRTLHDLAPALAELWIRSAEVEMSS